jgi:vacuolar-type H+-ATPase subunit H
MANQKTLKPAPHTAHIYPLSRVSSTAQVERSGHKRQQTSLDKISEKFKLPLAPVMQLDGISGFTGKHIESNTALGIFLEAVESGAIAKGSILVCDDPSRLSRMEVDDSSHLLTGIIRKGVGVYFTNTDTLIKKGDANLQIALLTALIHFSEAHASSKQKQRFVYAHSRGMAQAFIQGDSEAFRDGMPLAIRSAGAHPWWIDISDGTVRPHKYYFPIAQEITNMMIEGVGAYKITDHLNENYTPPKTNNSTQKISNKGWGINIALRWASEGKQGNTEALLGNRVFTLKDTGEEFRLDNYYPPVATYNDIKTIQAQRKARKGSTERKHSTLLCGIGILKCGYCGHSMVTHIIRGQQRIKCNGGSTKKSNCKAWSLPLNQLDDIACRLLASHVWKYPDSSSTPKTDELELELERIKSRINETEDAILNGDVSIATIGPILEKLRQQETSLTDEIKESQEEHLEPTSDWFEVTPRVLNTNEREIRSAAKEMFRRGIKEIKCFRGSCRKEFKYEITAMDNTKYSIEDQGSNVTVHIDPVPEDLDMLSYHWYTWAEKTKYRCKYSVTVTGVDFDEDWRAFKAE